MKTKDLISRQDVSSVNTECGMYDDELGQDKGTFGARETARRCSSKSGSDRVENESSEEDTNEGEMGRRALEDDLNYEIIESVEGFDGRENTSEEERYVDCRGRFAEKEDQTNHYAEILTKTEPCSSTTSMARRTRESSNPILCLRNGHRDTISSDIEDDRQSVVTQAQDDSVLYENTRTKTPSHSKLHHSRSDSAIALYANTTRGWETTPDDSHVYANFENRAVSSNTQMGKNDKRRNVSNETSDAESLYEDLDDVYEAMSPGTTSRPISIVYTSIDFSSKNASPSSMGSSSISSSAGSLERRSRCTSCCSSGLPNTAGKPPELPHRVSGSSSRGPRPRSLHLGNHNVLTEFGLYTGTLVGSCTVMKTSPKSIQQIIGDFLAREKKERSKPVSLEVTNEFLRLSLNCAPWSLLAQTSVEDIGCVTTLNANNRRALGYTISKPGEDTRCYVIHCADANAIKNAILSTFNRFDPSLSRWSSMSVLGTPRSGHSKSLPRTRSTSRHNDLGIFDDLVYLGSYKVKKSYLVVNDNITSVLDHTDSKHYTHAKLELYKDAIHLKDSKKDRILDIHQLEWILSMGLFDEDRRYFGYISSKAFQGSKTRTFCHVFRCSRVGFASRILETIRQACQATFLTKTPDYPPAFRSRTNSSTSSSSEGSVSSSSETMSIGSNSSSPPDTDRKFDIPGRVKRRSRLISKRNRMSTIRSFTENTESDILEEKDEEKLEVAVEHRFNVFYLCSTIVSPPLKPKHVKDCLKAYQKAVDKAMKKPDDSGQHYKKAQLVINQDGVMILDDATKAPQAFFEKASLASVHSHPKGKCAFAFTTVVSGNTKHKCHLFLQDKEPMGEITKVIQSNIQ